MAQCLAHSSQYRPRLEFVINSLRQANKLKQGQAAMVGPIVCSCRQQAQVHPFWADAEKVRQSIPECYQTLVAVSEIIDAFTDIDRRGLEKFLVLLDKISHQDFTLFERCCPPKEQKKIEEVIHRVHLESRFAGLFVGKRGRNMLGIRRATGCSVRVTGAEEVFWNSTTKIVGPPENLASACDLVDKKATEIQRKQNAFAEYQRRRELKCINLAKLKVPKVIYDLKTLNVDVYSRKQKHAQRNCLSAKEHHRLLARGSRCINCLSPFRLEDLSKQCRFHPGYIAKDAWSCCSLKASDSHPTFSDHVTTGCATSIHNYRPTQRRSGKNNLTSAKESTSGLLRAEVDTLRDFKL